MTDSPENNGRISRKTLKFSAAIIAAIMLLALIALLLVGILKSLPTELSSADRIEAAISDCNESYPTARQYLKAYGFGNLKMQKLTEAENYFNSYYVGSLDSPKAIAERTARLFLNSFTDPETGEYTINSEDRDVVTEAVLYCYVAAIGDKYSVYRSATEYEDYQNSLSGTYVGIGVVSSFHRPTGILSIVEVIENSPAERGGVLVGDIILAIDGQKIADVGYPGCVDLFKGESGSTVVLSVLRGEEELTLTLTRGAVPERIVTYTVIENNLGYVKISKFKDNTDEQLEVALSALKEAGVDGIIFDLCGNPGGYVNAVVRSLSLLVPKGTTVLSYSYKGYQDVTTSAIDGGIDVPVAVLCNGSTASAGELFTAAIRDWNEMGLISSVIIGEKTYGKGVVQRTYTLSDGSTITMTIAYCNPPSGVNYDGVGIEPDIEVDTTNESLIISTASAKLVELINANNN